MICPVHTNYRLVLAVTSINIQTENIVNTKATFEANYEGLTNEELLRIAADREELVEEAKAALDAELQKRGLRQGQAQKFKRNLQRITARDTVGRLGFSSRGYGKQFLGMSNYAADDVNGFEEFDSTLWFFFMFLPVVPLSTVHIRRRLKGKSFFWSFGRTDFTTMHLRGLNFGQVGLTYVGAAITAYIALQALLLLLSTLRP
ncbi:MAG: hypothetical protein ROO76_19385 [Terriglobia bacterium]|nr:hypothetical protein [Terriglobia bacterium]